MAQAAALSASARGGWRRAWLAHAGLRQRGLEVSGQSFTAMANGLSRHRGGWLRSLELATVVQPAHRELRAALAAACSQRWEVALQAGGV